MAVLTTTRRNKLKKSQYALASKDKKGKRGGAPEGAYPIPDRSHASNAKARAKQQLNKGNLSKSEYNTIVRKANAKLKSTGGLPKSAKKTKRK